MKNLKKVISLFGLSLLIISCQDMDTPELGEYPKDEANLPAGDLRFFVPFDKEGTQLKYKFAEDLSGYPCFTPDNSITQAAGVSGQGFKGGGAETYLRYLNANDFASKATSFTVAYWAKNSDSDKTEFTFALTSDNWAKASMFSLFEGDAAKPTVKFYVDEQPASGGSDKWFEWPSDPNLSGLYDNQWHHLAFVYDSTTSGMTMFVDGVSKGTKTWANHGPIKFNTSKINGFRIGGSGNPSEGWMKSWSGSLDQFRMYTKVLSQMEVQDLYTNKK
ncbi:hypothetical protein J2X97_000186 [Epilithonimonas hungarica]|uniref:LamG domain-containing protein n=1 Tax=Epilithonimonas hungarica TaxID=454006 RepID=UPI00278A613D|nr:LamG domain-containing protein [Epilithonimonas hungarica]MDP9954549.1 hypothetical protein [Epilithonimonas hungarica]